MTPDSQPLLRRSGSHRPERARETARRLKREGKTVTQIAAALGIPRATVGNWTRGVESSRPCRFCDRPFAVDVAAPRKYCSDWCSLRWRQIYGKAAA